jgi:hypothetical protein
MPLHHTDTRGHCSQRQFDDFEGHSSEHNAAAEGRRSSTAQVQGDGKPRDDVAVQAHDRT